MTKNASSGSLAVSKTLPTKLEGRPADKGHKVQIDPTNPGRHVLYSKAAERATAARTQLGKLNKSSLKNLTDEQASQMAKDLGLRIMRGTGASGDVTRGDYLAALEGLLPVAAKSKAKA